MRAFYRHILLVALTVVACSDYNITLTQQGVDLTLDPEIEVTPARIDFGSLNVASGESAQETVTIKNIGTDFLDIESIALQFGDAAYTIGQLSDSELEPNEEAVFIISYTPMGRSINANKIMIVSNDEDEIVSEVNITGEGDAPEIFVEPDYYDFGNTMVGCEQEVHIDVVNTGNVDLTIDTLNYFVSFPAELAVDIDFSIYGPLPWVMVPGETRTVVVYHAPEDEHSDAGYLETGSNDPATPVAYASQDGDAGFGAVYEENFEQREHKNVDILFIIDNSCSMSRHQTNLVDNFDTFINTFVASGVDYHIGFVTTDSENLVGPVISDAMVDPIGEVNTQITSIGILGSAHEKGLYYSYVAIQSGAEAGPGSSFWREDAKLVLIYVTDEDDHTTIGATPTSLYNYAIAAKGGSEYAVAHAVAGDVPGGCMSGMMVAYSGDVYHTVVGYFGGTFLSICAEDWGGPLETLANETLLSRMFYLALSPLEFTIHVDVDGTESTEWYYDSVENAVIFNEGFTPPSGAIISIEYSLLEECAE